MPTTKSTAPKKAITKRAPAARGSARSGAATLTELLTPAGAAAVDTRTVALDLDVLEREGERPAPFVFRHAGQIWTLADPREMDWQELLESLGNPLLLLRKALPKDAADAFFTESLPAWKLTALIEQYQRHYGIPTLPELAALSGSSAGTARQ